MNFDPKDKEYVHRLATALILCWDVLSDDMRKMLLREAALVEPQTALEQSIKDFISRHKGPPR